MGLRLPFATCGAFILLGLVLMVVVPRATPAPPAPAPTREAAITVTRVESPRDEFSDRVVARTLLDYDRDEPKECAPVAPPATKPVVVATPVAAPPGAATGVGFVRVSTYPWGWATAGDQKVETIGSGKLTLPVGRQTITITCGPECAIPREITRTVDVRANTTLPIRITWDDEDE